MATSKLALMLFVIVVATFQLQTTVAQTRHVVGDALGWTIPPSPGAYDTWASTQTFTVGDSLFFNFTTGFHDVATVSQAAYGPCTTANPMSTITNGPATIPLSAPGNYYFICTFGNHCSIGQKLTINVGASTSTPTTPTTPMTPTPTPSGAPAPGGSMMPPPPPAGNAATSFAAVVPATLLAAAFALFY